MDYAKLLKQIGFTDDQIPKAESTESEEVVGKRLAEALQASFKNNSDFRNSIIEEVKPTIVGQITGEYQRKIKQGLGLDIDIKDGVTKVEDILTAAKTKLDSAATKTVQDQQKEFDKVQKELEGKVTTLEGELTETKKGFETKSRFDEFRGKVRTRMNGFKLTAPAQALEPYVMDKLKTNYDLVEDGTVVTINAKGKKERPMNGHKVLTDDEVIDKILTDEKLIVPKKIVKEEGIETHVENVEGGGKKVKYESEATRKIREEQAARTKSDNGQ